MKEKIKEYFGELLMVMGSFIATYNLFNFRSSFYGSKEGGLSLPSFGSTAVGDPAVYYYYNNESLLLLSLGIALIVTGLFIFKAKGRRIN